MSKALEQQFISLLKENQRIIHKVCKIYTDNPVEHEDLFQEICVQLWKSYPSFRGEAKFSTWMYRIALNTAISLFRKTQKSIQTYQESDYFKLKITIEDYQDDSDKIAKMYDAIHRMTDIEKALIMMYLDDKSYREISEILGITEGNARVKMNRAKEKLKTLIR